MHFATRRDIVAETPNEAPDHMKHEDTYDQQQLRRQAA